jgi:hypothetical protein
MLNAITLFQSKPNNKLKASSSGVSNEHLNWLTKEEHKNENKA